MPLELDASALALHYHLFALAPLVMLAELGEANGVDLYDEGDGAIRRLADRVIDGLARSGTLRGRRRRRPAVNRPPPRGADLAWAEPYYARFHDPAARRLSWPPRGRCATIGWGAI